jgi:hypothetical protein
MARDPSRAIRAGLFGLAFVLVIVGSLLTLLTVRLTSIGREVASATVTAWGVSLDDAPRGLPEGAFGAAPTFGVPLVIGAVILLGAAVLCLVGRSAVLVGAVGAAFLAGVVWAVALQESATSDSFTNLVVDPRNQGFGIDAGMGAGFWLLIAAAAVAIAGAGLTAVAGRK